jgi:hypothetical protein
MPVSSLKGKQKKANNWHFLMRLYTQCIMGGGIFDTPNSLLPGTIINFV